MEEFLLLLLLLLDSPVLYLLPLRSLQRGLNCSLDVVAIIATFAIGAHLNIYRCEAHPWLELLASILLSPASEEGISPGERLFHDAVQILDALLVVVSRLHLARDWETTMR